MNYIDIGVNLTHRQFDPDRDDVLNSAVAAGVTRMILTGTSVRGSAAAADYASKHPGLLYSTAGVHPHDVKGCDDTTIDALRKLCALPQVVAVGECGLDYDRDFSPRDAQRKWFRAQIELAAELSMPLFLHERAAFTEFKDILSHYPLQCKRSVVHCFTGTEKEVSAYLAMGCYIGITGWICDERRGTELRQIVKSIPADRLMIETDAPFLIPRNLNPRPDSGRNRPDYLPHIAADIARCRGESPESLAEATTKNALDFFCL